jgi:hypothetical protein
MFTNQHPGKDKIVFYYFKEDLLDTMILAEKHKDFVIVFMQFQNKYLSSWSLGVCLHSSSIFYQWGHTWCIICKTTQHSAGEATTAITCWRRPQQRSLTAVLTARGYFMVGLGLELQLSTPGGNGAGSQLPTLAENSTPRRTVSCSESKHPLGLYLVEEWLR